MILDMNLEKAIVCIILLQFVAAVAVGIVAVLVDLYSDLSKRFDITSLK